MTRLHGVLVLFAAYLSAATPVFAQSLGNFRWQLQPYCNVVTVTVTQNGGLYTLDGYDDQCGAPTRASVVGTAVPNPNGTITLGFTIVTTPGGTPVHVQTALSLATLGGAWSDSAGRTGALVFTPGAGTAGAPRPDTLAALPDNSVTSAKIADGTVGAADINVSQVQRRVASTCPAGQLMTAVNPDGTVVCEAVTSTSGGDVTSVAAGSGLTGGGTSGAVTLALATGGVTNTHVAPGAIDASKIADGTVSAADIDHAQVQTRVTGTCPVGQAIRAVTLTGAVTCEPVSGAAGGDITGVVAGSGLTGGAAAGDAALAVNFAGSGSAVTVARSDHEHLGFNSNDVAVGPLALRNTTFGGLSTAVGSSALAGNTTGERNTAVGASAMSRLVSGQDNTALGYATLERGGEENVAVGSFAMTWGASTDAYNVAVGPYAAFRGGQRNTAVGYEVLREAGVAGTAGNTAVGYRALREADQDLNSAVGAEALLTLTTGRRNSVFGVAGLDSLVTGDNNVGVGGDVLSQLTSGNANTAVGYGAGFGLQSGSSNVYLATSAGAPTENGTMRLGGAGQTRTFIANVRGVATGANNAVNVVIDSAGQLGTISSSRKTKFDIQDLDPAVSAALQHLRPVQFRYLKPFADGTTPIQYGLIAEEVGDVLPELVATDDAGDPASVKYYVLPSLLLAEVQRLERERVTAASRLAAQIDEVARLRAAVAQLESAVAAMAQAAARR